jgi:hypothetical protein
MVRGVLPVRIWEASSAKVVSRTQCRPFWIVQWPLGQPGGAGLLKRQAGDRIDGHGLPPGGVQLAGLAGDLQDLGGVRESEVADRDRFEGPDLDAAVAAVAGAVTDRDVVPWQAGAAFQQPGLVGLHREEVVGMLAGDQELGGLGVGLQRAGGHYHTGQVEPIQQRGERGDFLGRAGDLALGQHLAGGVVHRRQQMRRTATCAGRVGATEGLAVHGHCPPPSGWGSTTAPILVVLPVGQPGADHPGQHLGVQPAERAADGGLGRDAKMTGACWRAPSAARTGWGASAAHSAIAAIDRAPASTAAAAMASIASSGWRRPRALLGSGTRAR